MTSRFSPCFQLGADVQRSSSVACPYRNQQPPCERATRPYYKRTSPESAYPTLHDTHRRLSAHRIAPPPSSTPRCISAQRTPNPAPQPTEAGATSLPSLRTVQLLDDIMAGTRNYDFLVSLPSATHGIFMAIIPPLHCIPHRSPLQTIPAKVYKL